MERAHRRKVRAVQAVAVLCFVGAWLYLQGPGDVSPIILPELTAVAAELWTFATSGDLYAAAAVTFAEIFAALAIGGLAGFAVGFWGARTELRSKVVEPLLVWGYLVPHVLFYPLFLLWLGFGVSSKIGYAAASAFFPIAFNCLRGFQRVDPRYTQVGRAFGASPRQLDTMIKFRAGLPMAAAGLKLGAAVSMITVIVAEMLGSSRGLGFLIQLYSQSFSPPRTYAIISVVLVIVGIFQFALKRLLREDAGVVAR